MNSKNILVTGGAGFMGSHVADYLINEGHKVTILDDLSGGYLENVNPDAEFIKGSINDRDLVDKVTKDKNIVYHLAAYAAEGLSHFVRNFNYNNNLIGSINLINSSIKSGVDRFLFTSSMAVYGSGEPPFDETTIPHPEDPYGISKFAVEMDLEAAKKTHSLEYTILRPHNVYGERQNIADPYRNVIGIFMNRIMEGLPPLIFGDGKQTRAFSYIEDVSPFIAKAPFIEEAKGEIINIGSGKMYSLNDLAKVVIDAMKLEVIAEHVPPRYEVEHAYCTTEKSERILGFEERTSLEEGIKKMALWAKEKGPMKPTIWKSYELNKNLPNFWKDLKETYNNAEKR